MAAIPIPDPDTEEQKKRIRLEGEIPSPVNPKPGCRFVTRCRYATEKCHQEDVYKRQVYERGKPKRNDYRKFHIKGVQGADDYASMREVLTRRFRHGLEEQKSGKELGLSLIHI